MIKIRHRYTRVVICSGKTVRDAVRKAVEGNISLAYANLAGQDLGGMCLTDADFSNVNFRGAILVTTNFTRSNLFGSDFCDADLQEANFGWATVTNVNLERANIRDLNLRGAISL